MWILGVTQCQRLQGGAVAPCLWGYDTRLVRGEPEEGSRLSALAVTFAGLPFSPLWTVSILMQTHMLPLWCGILAGAGVRPNYLP